MERRDAERKELDAKVVITVGEKQVETRIKNMSKDGVLFRIAGDYVDALTNDDLSERVQFTYDGFSSSNTDYSGEIVRFFNRDKEKYIAVRFFEYHN